MTTTSATTARSGTADATGAVRDIVDFRRYSEKFLKVLPSERSGKLIPLKLNYIQLKLHAMAQAAIARGEKPWFLILKHRRPGVTTYVQGRIYHQVSTHENLNAVTLAHTSDDTEKIFHIQTRYYDRSPADLRPYRKGVGSKREQNFPILGSHHWTGTAGSKDFGRGGTLHYVHGSEVAFWPQEKLEARAGQVPSLVSALLEAGKDGEVWFESTPNGMGNWFYREVSAALSGDSQFILVFIPWFLDPANRLPLNNGPLEYTETEQALADRYGLVPEQIRWRRDKQSIHREKFPQEFPEDPITCFLTSGMRFFTEDVVGALVAEAREPAAIRDDGAVRVWEPPVHRRRYVAGADVGEGLEHGDRSVLGIMDYETGEQVATLAGRWRPETFAEKAASLCREYNTALLGVESNNHGHSTLNTLRNRLSYPNLYWRTVGHPRDMARRTSRLPAKKLGWETNALTRPLMLDELEEAMRSRYMTVNDMAFLGECRTFVDTGAGKYEASAGDHDDRVIAWAIAWQMRKTPGGSVGAFGERTFTHNHKGRLGKV